MEIVPFESRFKTIASVLNSKSMQEQLALALPKTVTPDRLARLILNQIRRIPLLAQCERESFLGAVMEIAQLGLEVGVLGQAWILPFKNEKNKTIDAQVIIGYRGMEQLAYRSSMVASINASVVYDGDRFLYERGLRPKLRHSPAGDSTFDPALITHAYAIVKLVNGGVVYEVMTRGEIEAIRKRSRAGRSGPWVTDYAEMCKKTVLRRTLKHAPASAELQRAMVLDEEAETPDGQTFGNVRVAVEEIEKTLGPSIEEQQQEPEVVEEEQAPVGLDPDSPESY